jgi:SAM-dependent methyltransferase
MRNNQVSESPAGLLGDTPERDYSRKLSDFNSFAEPELRRLIASLQLRPGMRVLDAGCGTGEALNWLLEAVGPDGEVVGIDLSAPHVAVARSRVCTQIKVLQGNLLHAPFAPDTFDLIWSVNTLNHLHEPVEGVRSLAALLRPGARIAVGQSSLVPDMYFAWDARLERLTNEAVRQYYRDRYGLDERSLGAVRGLVGVLRRSGLTDVRTQTLMIERISPVSAADETYLVETLFRNTWGERLRPYLLPEDFVQLMRLCDPADVQFALRRADFHFLQSFTLCVGATR